MPTQRGPAALPPEYLRVCERVNYFYDHPPDPSAPQQQRQREPRPVILPERPPRTDFGALLSGGDVTSPLSGAGGGGGNSSRTRAAVGGGRGDGPFDMHAAYAEYLARVEREAREQQEREQRQQQQHGAARRLGP